MYLNRPTFLLRALFLNTVTWEIPSAEKVLFLTFDDGPDPSITPEILKILEDYSVKAGFFCVGENLERYRALSGEAISAGHEIGNHTYSHLNGWKTETFDYCADVQRFDALFRTSLFRPPYGKITPAQLTRVRRDHRVILWTVLTGDFDKGLSPGQCLQNAVTHSRPGSIVVFHDNEKFRKNVLYALPGFLDHFLSLGYRFDLVSSGLETAGKTLAPGYPAQPVEKS